MTLLLYLLALAGFGWCAYWTYTYFFDTEPPHIDLFGVTECGSYASEVSLVVELTHDYKVADVSAWVDEVPIVTRSPIRAREVAYPLTLDTRSLSSGVHTLCVEARDATYARNVTREHVSFYVDNTPLYAAFVTHDTENKVWQGRTLHVQFQLNKPIKRAVAYALSREHPCTPEVDHSNVYECFIPIPSDTTPNEYLMRVHIEDFVGNTTTLERPYHVAEYPFKQQKLNVQSSRKPEHDDSVRSDAELENDIYWYTHASEQRKMWHGPFFVPCDIQGISTEFGTMRTTQQYGKYRHDAIDVLAPPRTVVWACQDGVIVIKDTFERSGNTVVIDHGCGVLSLYFHLNSFADIQSGQHILRGKPIGYLGKTGYASGYHLHWEVRVQNIPVDPMEWTQQRMST